MTEQRYNLRALSRALFEPPKRWWGIGLSCKLAIFLVSAVVVLSSFGSKYAPLLVALLNVLAEVCLWQSDQAKATAEALLRKLDTKDSFGWPISGPELADFLLAVPNKVRSTLLAGGPGEQYFVSTEGVGPRRAIENVQESAWWSKHLASRMALYCLLVTCLLVVGSVTLLGVSIEMVRDPDRLAGIGRVLVSTLALVFSIGLFGLSANYHIFSRRAAAIEQNAEGLLSMQFSSEDQAIKLLHEYQLARALAPLIPTWIYRLSRNALNEAWRQRSHQQEVPAAPAR
jgi:hypothetical protein